MDLKSYMATRRTIPSVQLAQPAPDDATLGEMLALASRTPDHGKLAPWRFIVVRGESQHKLGALSLERAIATAADAGRELTQPEKDKAANAFSNAPLVVVVVSTAGEHPKIPQWEQELAVGATCMNLIHAANAHGFKAQWLTGWQSTDQPFTEKLGLSGSEKVAGFFHIGTPQEEPFERPRPNVDDLTSVWVG